MYNSDRGFIDKIYLHGLPAIPLGRYGTSSELSAIPAISK